MLIKNVGLYLYFIVNEFVTVYMNDFLALV